MLTQEALDSAAALTSVLDSRGLYLMPREGTALYEIVRATRSDSTMVNRDATGEVHIDFDGILHMANARDKTLGTCDHDRAMDAVVELATRAVTEHMVHARSIVAPAITSLVEKTSLALKGMNPSSLLGADVQVHALPAPTTTDAFERMVKKFEGVPFDPPLMTLNLPSLPARDVIELMHTGSAVVDAAIDDWAKAKGDAFIDGVWGDVFQINPVAKGKTAKGFGDFVEDKTEGVDYALAIFLVARKLVESGPLQGTEQGLKQFERAVVEFRNQAGARLCRFLSEQDLIDKSGQLVRRVDGAVTYVNERVYRSWIEGGGDNDVLFGNTLRGTPHSSVAALNGNAKELRDSWQRHSAVQVTIENNRRFQRTKEVLRQAFYQDLASLTEEEEYLTGNRDAVMKLFDEQLDKTTKDEMDDLWSLCLRLVCRSRFVRSDAETILSGIERVRKQNPSITVREAAAVSMLEYIASWVASQFRVEKRSVV